MNKKGLEYCKKMEALYNNRPKEEKYPLPLWQDSLCQERMMRMGIEVKVYELDVNDYSEMERVARAAIIEDREKSFKLTE